MNNWRENQLVFQIRDLINRLQRIEERLETIEKRQHKQILRDVLEKTKAKKGNKKGDGGADDSPGGGV